MNSGGDGAQDISKSDLLLTALLMSQGASTYKRGDDRRRTFDKNFNQLKKPKKTIQMFVAGTSNQGF